MTKWKQALNAAVSGNLLPHMMPPHINYLSLPPITDWQDNVITIVWHATEDIYQGGGMVFGGYLSALADYAAGTAMLTSIKDEDVFATHKLEIEYKRPVQKGTMTIKAEVKKITEKHFDVEVIFINENNQVCAISTVHQTIIKP